MLAAWLFVALNVQAAGGCPGAADVTRQLTPLLGDDTATRDVATIVSSADGSVSLSLADPSGQSIGARSLPPARTCAEQAKAVAVTLAVWEAQLHPEIALALDRLAPAEPPAAPARSEVVVVARPAPAVPAPAPWAFSLGVAVMGDLQSSAWAPGARLELGLGPAGARWRGRLAVAGVGQHHLELPPGTVSWSRAFVQVGADVDVARGRHGAFTVGAGAIGGVASISGAGFPTDRATRSIDVGGEARARGEARLGSQGHIRPWVGIAAAMWVRRQGLAIEGTTTVAALPRFEPVAALGADFVW